MAMWRGIVALAAAVVFVAVIAGCGSDSSAEQSPDIPPLTKELDITLDGYPGPETLGILMAEKRGYFEDAYLDVWVRTPVSRLNPLRYVAEEEVALAVAPEPQVELVREKGTPVEPFGSLISEPTTALIWLKKSKIAGIADLEGKTIGIVGLQFERDMLGRILAQADLTLDDVNLRRFDYDLFTSLTQGRADAILGSSNIEGAAMEALGLAPVVTPVESIGVSSGDELMLVARSERLDKEPHMGPRFMAAVRKGTEAAVADPQAAVKAVAQANGEPVTKPLEAEVEATLPLLSAEPVDP